MAKKNFVVDTNVLIHNPECVFLFGDNNVVISPVVLEELDAIKTQNRMASKDARQAIRNLESLVEGANPKELGSTGVIRNAESGRLIIPSLRYSAELIQDSNVRSNDKRIIRDALLLMHGYDGFIERSDQKETFAQECEAPRNNLETVFISKDLNARLIARAHGLHAEDYKAARIEVDWEEFPSGFCTVTKDQLFSGFINEHKGREFHFKKDVLQSFTTHMLHPHMTFYLECTSVCYTITSITEDKVICELRPAAETPEPFGVKAKDYRQSSAIRALMDDTIPLVVITGEAGSGKTLMAIAAGLEKMGEGRDPRERKFKRIIVSRALEDLDKDIGALPGTEEEKVKPWMGGIEDNIEYLLSSGEDAIPAQNLQSTLSYAERYFEYKSINYMRGRNIQGSIFVIDEGQNLTPAQMKTLVSRAGQNCKVVVLGDLDQIDNPYLSKHSSGLTYLVERMRHSQCMAHYHLKGSPRSELASEVNKLL
jgi:PhoH-like ATPase